MNNEKEQVNPGFALSEKLAEVCRKELMTHPLPVGVFTKDREGQPVGAMVIYEGGSVVRITREKQIAGTVESLSFTHLAMLLERGVRGVELQKQLSTVLSNAVKCIEGDEIFESVCRKIEQQGSNSQAIYNLLNRVNEDSRQKGQLVGCYITQPVADGYAHYMVVGQRGSECRLRYMQILDGYTVAQWGIEAWVPKRFVEDELSKREKALGSTALVTEQTREFIEKLRQNNWAKSAGPRA